MGAEGSGSWLNAAWHYFLGSVFCMFPLAGTALNVYVLVKLRKIAR